MSMSPDELAKACAERMWSQDTATQQLDMHLSEVRAGHTVMSMTVTKAMTNGHGICHGGYIFTLADSAFAFACNTYNNVTVAQQCNITFLMPAHLDDRLTATARELSRTGRSGLYDVTVSNQNGDVIAEFRGNSRTTKGTILPE